jgi:hypothetical protein
MIRCTRCHHYRKRSIFENLNSELDPPKHFVEALGICIIEDLLNILRSHAGSGLSAFSSSVAFEGAGFEFHPSTILAPASPSGKINELVLYAVSQLRRLGIVIMNSLISPGNHHSRNMPSHHFA